MAGSSGRWVLTVAGTQKHAGARAMLGDEARVYVWQSLGCLFSEGIINQGLQLSELRQHAPPHPSERPNKEMNTLKPLRTHTMQQSSFKNTHTHTNPSVIHPIFTCQMLHCHSVFKCHAHSYGDDHQISSQLWKHLLFFRTLTFRWSFHFQLIEYGQIMCNKALSNHALQSISTLLKSLHRKSINCDKTHLDLLLLSIALDVNMALRLEMSFVAHKPLWQGYQPNPEWSPCFVFEAYRLPITIDGIPHLFPFILLILTEYLPVSWFIPKPPTTNHSFSFKRIVLISSSLIIFLCAVCFVTV